MTDMTPPPMRKWSVVIDSPELPGRYAYDLEARVEAEARVLGAEAALAVAASKPPLPARLRKLCREDAVTGIAKYATATAAA